MQSIHCKVSLSDNEFRRFQFNYNPSGEDNFVALQNRIRTLYGIDDDFVLKYKDDEGDLIIFESNEELKYGVTESAGLLRIFVELKKTDSSLPPTPSHSVSSVQHEKSKRRGKQPRDIPSKIERLTSKRTRIAELLTNTEVISDEKRKFKFQKNLASIDLRLAILISKTEQTTSTPVATATPTTTTPIVSTQTVTVTTTPVSPTAPTSTTPMATTTPVTTTPIVSTPTVTATTQSETITQIDNEVEEESSTSEEEKYVNPKKYDKRKKREQKLKNKRQRNVRRNLSENDKVTLVILKGQIRDLKPSLNAIKIQIAEKKASKADARSKGDTNLVGELNREIKQLKEIKKEKNQAIAPLKQQIRAIKFEPQSNC